MLWQTLKYEELADREFKHMTPEEKAFCRQYEERLDKEEEERRKRINWMEVM